MEHTLRCNSLKCRKLLNDHAVVTTCSHIFCIDCSNELQISGQREGRRPICPACDAQLPNPDDVVVANLNPTEDYKTSVLSGLSPQIIMECAGRGLSFWAYQTTQEIVYHEYLAKSLSDKYATLNTQLDKVVNDANSEISSLRNKISNLLVDQEQGKRKNEDLIQALRDKTRKYLQTQELYDKLKRRSMLGQVQIAALDAVDESIQASVAANRYADPEHRAMRPPPPPILSNQQDTMRRTSNYSDQVRGMPSSGQGLGLGNNTFAGYGVPTSSHNQPLQTPSTHRQRLAPEGGSFAGSINISNQGSNTILRGHSRQTQSTPRQPLVQMSGNSGLQGFAGYGMSAGLKVSNPPGSAGGMRPVNRARVAQRPTSGFAGRPSPNFGPPTTSVNMFSNANNNVC